MQNDLSRAFVVFKMFFVEKYISLESCNTSKTVSFFPFVAISCQLSLRIILVFALAKMGLSFIGFLVLLAFFILFLFVTCGFWTR